MPTKSMSHCQGKGSLSHNNREFIYQNVDPSRTKDNITYISESLAEAYQKCFGEATKIYNEKQTRDDRKIDVYYSHLFGKQQQNSVAVGSNKQKSFYESLVQVGTKNDSGVGSTDGHVVAKCLDEYMRSFQERNPQFYVFNAVLHNDEATPHLHIDYIPVAIQKKGMEKQNGIAKALEQMGYGKGKDAINRWRLSERKELEMICERHGIKISEPAKSRGSLSVEEYKTIKDSVKEEARIEFEKEYDAFSEIQQEIETLKQEKADLQEFMQKERIREAAENKIKYDKLTKIDQSKHKRSFIGNTVSVPFKEYKTIMQRAEWYRRGIGLKEREEAVAKNELKIDEREKAANRVLDSAAELNKTRTKLNDMENKLESAQYKISSLRLKLDDSEREKNFQGERYEQEIETLKEALNGAYESGVNVVKAYGEAFKKLKLPPDLANLHEANKKYIAKWAREDGFPDLAKQVLKEIGISKGIQNILTPPPPDMEWDEREERQTRTKSIDYGPSL